MIIRGRLNTLIEHSLSKYPVIGLIGPRQAGKTTLAKTLQGTLPKKSVYLDLELSSDLSKLHSPELYLKQFSDDLVIIDEIQRMPSLFPLIRALVDQNRVNGRFLILGSASPALIRQASESLAGRIRYHELTPFTLDETRPRSQKDVARLWLRGGYPNSYLSENDDDSLSWRDAFIKTYLEMDIPQLGIRVPAIQLRRFWTMLAHLNGQLWNASQIAGSLGISPPTARHYLDILEDTFIVRQLQPYHVNIKKRLVKSPKVYMRDTGILHALLSLKDRDSLMGHPTVGSSWESFVIEQILAIVPERWKAFFYRTSAGAELDLLLVDEKGRTIGIEIKHSAAPVVTRGFWSALEDVSCSRGFVVYPGDESYPLGENVVTVPIRELSRIVE
ncbi:MAG: ATP-binding protein [Nitrospirota bacterium]|nr:ATP-binding protein [Nitrospirota bacterium]